MGVTNKQAADALRAMAAARMFYAKDHAEDLDECGFLALEFMRDALLKGAKALETKEGARVGKWEEDEDGLWHHCGVCGAEADEDGAGNKMLTPYCSRCGAFLGGEYD